jgi:hypothetical protein
MTPKREELLDALEKARKAYLDSKRDPHTLYCVGALVYLEALRDHYSSGASALITRMEFANRIKNHENWEKKPGGSFKNAADDCGKELRKFTPVVTVNGESWRLRFHGPTARHRMNDRESEGIGFEVVREVLHDIDLTLHLPDLKGRCICCPSRTDFHVYDRFCTNDACSSHSFTRGEQRLYVTIVPERRADYAGKAAVDYGFLQHPGGKAREISERARQLLPYTTDHLAEHGLHLGKPLLYRSSRLEAYTKLAEVWVLDMSGYLWTNTLKDARSWAIVNIAHELGIRMLALYTAGNAGMSLAKVAYAARRVLDQPLDVYALFPEGVDPEIRTQLRAWGCRPIIPKSDFKRILDHRDVWRWVNIEISGNDSEVPPERAWHVTDGWDGVGVLMYRLLFAEACANVHPDFAVVPLGTGNLFLGTYLALTDIFGPAAAQRLIGALPPPPNNILANFDADRPVAEGADIGTMPKLVGRYSPLTPAVKYVVQTLGAKLITVTPRMHREMSEFLARDYLVDRADPLVAFEPSAAAAAAALVGVENSPGLRELIEQARTSDVRSARVLIANTGLGVLGSKEFEFLHDAHYPKR